MRRRSRARRRRRCAGTAGHRGCDLPTFGPGATYHPDIDAARFSPHVTNPYFPLRPGVTFVYQGVDSGRPAIDVFAPSRHTKVINGVHTRVVHDQVYIRNVLEERTSDYYAQDRVRQRLVLRRATPLSSTSTAR